MNLTKELHETISILRRSPDDWFKKHLLVVKLFGYSESEATEYAKYIEEVQKDMFSFAKKLFKVLTLFMIAGTALAFVYWNKNHDIIKLIHLTAKYLGVVGTFLGSYGFLFYRQGLKEYTAPSGIWNHYCLDAPLDPPSTQTFIWELVKYIHDHSEEHARDCLSKAKLEIRKQLAIFFAFILIFISLLIPIVLAFC
ncbi:MAG: hypothetical protein P4N41_10020 [Negativicutes bacterium]|nr:hypothetical protein [Negativicutes bacterium]